MCNVKEVHTDFSMYYHSAVFGVLTSFFWFYGPHLYCSGSVSVLLSALFSDAVGININSTYCTCSAPEDRLAKLAENIIWPNISLRRVKT